MHLGIDFGTCYSSAALMLDDRPKAIKESNSRGYSFASSIFVSDRGDILVGQTAENARQKNPHQYRREFKRDLGTFDPYTLGNFVLLPEELIAKVLEKLKSEADKVAIARRENPLTNAILTIPATYTSNKRKLMEEAAHKAGFEQVELLAEPIAAAVYYSDFAKVKEGEIVLVYDLGGGTFDASLIQKQASGYQLLGMPRGLAHCGGIDFDRLIYQHLKSQCSPPLREQLNGKDAWLARAIVSDLCRDLKHQLSDDAEATIHIPIGLGSVESFTLTREVFEQMIAPLIAETVECSEQVVRSANLTWDKVEHLLLVGGSCRIPHVKEALERKIERPCLLVDEPELAVCFGAAIYRTPQESTVQENVVEEKISPTVIESKPQQEDAETFYKRGIEQLQKQAYSDAIAVFNRALQIQPDYAEVRYERAIARLNLGDIQGAIEDSQEAAKLFFDGDDLAGYKKALARINEINKSAVSPLPPPKPQTQNLEECYQQGLDYNKQESYQEAIASFEGALKLAPNHAGAYCYRGFAYFCLGNYQQASEDCDRALQIDSNYADAYICRGLTRFGMGNNLQATQDINKVIQLDSKHEGAYLVRSLMRASFRDHQGALADFNWLRRLAPDYNSAEHNRILAFAVQGNKSEVITYLQKTTKRFFKGFDKSQTTTQVAQNFQSVSTQKTSNIQSQSLQIYLLNRQRHFLAKGFEWHEAVTYNKFSFRGVANGKRSILLLPCEVFFMFADFTSLDIDRVRNYARQSLQYCNFQRGTGLKLKGLICYPVALVEELTPATATAIQHEPPTYDSNGINPANFTFPVIFNFKDSSLYTSEKSPIFNWAGWSSVRNIMQEMLL
jgi:molecular chaperone DnaK (HSP70)